MCAVQHNANVCFSNHNCKAKVSDKKLINGALNGAIVVYFYRGKLEITLDRFNFKAGKYCIPQQLWVLKNFACRHSHVCTQIDHSGCGYKSLVIFFLFLPLLVS